MLQLNNLDLKGFSFHALATEVYDVSIALQYFFARYLRVVVSCMYSTLRAYLKLGLYFTQSSFTCGWSLLNEFHLFIRHLRTSMKSEKVSTHDLCSAVDTNQPFKEYYRRVIHNLQTSNVIISK